MNIQRISRKLRSVVDLFSATAKVSYSQFAEDLLVDNVLSGIMEKRNPAYLDIGTNDPVRGNNTYLFYMRHNQGVCVEPDPAIYEKIRAKRKRDTVLHAGIGVGTEKEGTLYIFPGGYTGWNTFSKEEADKRKEESGIAYTASNKIPFIPVNEVIEKYFDTCPDFISIDVEGMDLAILESLDFAKYKPAVICAETVILGTANKGVKRNDIIGFLLSKGYITYADTYVNTIFVRQDIFN